MTHTSHSQDDKAEPASLVERALAQALNAHAGQRDKAGKPYILHPLRIMAKMDDPISQAAALLHDVLEDSETTTADLEADGFPAEVIEAVVALTRRPGESYVAFIERIRLNALARRIKLADIEDNLSVLRLPHLEQPDLCRIEKYHRAWHRLSI